MFINNNVNLIIIIKYMDSIIIFIFHIHYFDFIQQILITFMMVILYHLSFPLMDIQNHYFYFSFMNKKK